MGYMRPLDGVRAIAVLSVLAYHGGVSALPGGFLGVDTFFVLSGFLITLLLITEWRTTATIRLGAFWARRARRLLPALLLVLLFVAAFVSFVAPPGTYQGLRGDGVATLFYVANWHFIAAGANYFSASGPVSPLTHTWSLALEEQFYFVWPLVVLGVLRLCRHRWVTGVRALLAVSAGGAIASAALMAGLYTGTNDTRLYYGTDTHAQSVLTGAALATALVLAARARLRRTQVPDAGRLDHNRLWVATTPLARVICNAVGLAGLLVTIILWTHVSGSPWWLFHGGFLVAAVATAVVLLGAVAAPRAALARLLSLRPLRYVGRISYGLYLWHFPLFILLNPARTGLDGWGLLTLRLAVTGLVATASFYLVEQPIRQGSLLRGWRGLAVGPAGMAVVAGCVVLATIPAAGSSGLALAPPPGDHRTAHFAAQRSQPTTNPGSGPASVLLVGDSMAETLGNGIGGQVGDWFGLNIVNGGTPNCALATGTFEIQDNPPEAPAPPCIPGSADPGWPTDWSRLVDRYRPQVSVFLARLDVVNHYFDGGWTHIGDPAYDTYLLGQLRLAVKVLTTKGGKVVLLTSPYYDTGEQPNGAPWPEDDPARVQLFNSMLRQVAADFPGQVSVIDLNALVDPDGTYTEFIDGVEIRFTDGIHWTYEGDCWLAPRILPLIAQVATTGRPTPSAAAPALVAAAVRSFPTSLCHPAN